MRKLYWDRTKWFIKIPNMKYYCTVTHSPANIDIAETLFGESYAKQLKNIPLLNNKTC